MKVMKQPTLMELVDECSSINQSYHKEDENVKRASELEDLGFDKLANELIEKVEQRAKLDKLSQYKYVQITDKKIGLYLDRKVERYNEEHPKEKEKNVLYHASFGSLTFGSGIVLTGDPDSGWNFEETPPMKNQREVIIMIRSTNDYRKTGDGTIGKFCWTETPVEKYETLPPKHILDLLKMHKDRHVFDYFSIASVNAVVDPLLLGRIDGSSDRFFIAQWGEDIQLDDVI